MKVFNAVYYKQTASHSWESYTYIVVAATIHDVLPDIMNTEPNTEEKLWDIEEIDTTKRSCALTLTSIY